MTAAGYFGGCTDKQRGICERLSVPHGGTRGAPRRRNISPLRSAWNIPRSRGVSDLVIDTTVVHQPHIFRFLLISSSAKGFMDQGGKRSRFHENFFHPKGEGKRSLNILLILLFSSLKYDQFAQVSGSSRNSILSFQFLFSFGNLFGTLRTCAES